MYKFYRCILLLLLPLLVKAQSFTPEPDWRFENFNTQNHFLNRFVGDLTIDGEGYLWTASIGVQKFDGTKLVEYSSLNRAPGSLKDNYTDVIADSTGRVWVSSLGLCYYNRVNNQFVYVQPDAKHKLEYAYSFAIQGNLLWFRCNYGLANINLKTLKISLTSLKKPQGSVMCIFPIDKHTLLVSCYTKQYIYNIDNDTYTIHTLVYYNKPQLILGAERSGSDIYLSTGMGLYVTKDINHIDLSGKPLCDFSSLSMVFMPGDKEKRYLFLSMETRGLGVYDTFKKRLLYTYAHDDGNPYSLGNNIVNKVFADKKNRLWIATATGVSMLDLNSQQWKLRFVDSRSPFEHYVYKMAADKFDSTRVWASSWNNGMMYIDWRTKKVDKLFDINHTANGIKDFVQVSKKRIIMLISGAIVDWNPETNARIFDEKLPYTDATALLTVRYKLIIIDSMTFFVSTSKGLMKYDLRTHRMDFALKEGDKDRYSSTLGGYFDNGIVWVAKTSGGLLRINVSTGESTLYKDTETIDSDFFNAIPILNNTQIACPSLNGVAIFDKKTKKFNHLRVIADLNGPKCISAIEVNNVLWVGSEAGVLYYDLKTHKSAKFQGTGPQMEIFPRSPFAKIGHDIAIGFREGYAYFKPNLKNIGVPSNPVIESFKVNNQLVLFPRSKTGVGKLILSHEENAVNIAFTAFLFNDPDNVNFRYQLKGADKSWQYATDQRIANYAQLQPGDYTFYVQSGNANGDWNNHITSVSFYIRPAFWATWWFRGLIILIIGLVLYRLYQYKIGHIKAIESIRQNIASDFHDDLGSTLSSISIFSEVAVQKTDTDLEGAKTMVGDIGVRARAMIHSMNDMVWTIKPENDNLYKLMQRMEEFSYPVAEAKEIQLSFLMDERLYDIKTDMVKRKNLFLIFKESFNNAMKYSGADNIQVHFKFSNKKLLRMQIIDNGCGFKYESRRPGNGLVNMQKRAIEIKGKLTVNTAPGKGTDINIICKIA